VLVVNHLIPPQVEADCHGDQEDDARSAEEARFKAAFEAEEGGVDLVGLAQIGEAESELPAAGGDPVDEDRQDDNGEDVAAEELVKGQIEEIEGEWLVKDGVVPCGGGGGEPAGAGEADDGPGVDGRGGNQVRE
jgi:hypothetical protein